MIGKAGFFFLISLSFINPLHSADYSNMFPYSSTESTFNFIIYAHDPEFSRGVAQVIEGYREGIINDMGWSSFRTSADKIRIFIHRTKEEFQGNLSAPHWSGGLALTRQNEIHLFPHPYLISSTLPHELSHLIFRNIFGEGFQPWLDEGLAVYEEFRFSGYRLDSLHLNQVLLGAEIPDLESYLAQSPSDSWSQKRTVLWYLTAASLVNFLIKKYGLDRFHNFLKKIRSSSINEALNACYPQYEFGNIEELKRKWISFLQSEGT